jgi:protein ImuB
MPLAVSDVIERRERIIDCNPAALSGGIKPGMPVTAALGILDDLQIVERDRAAEQRALRRLAAWCYQYSSQVCIPGDRPGLFLEAGASQRLFGCPADLGARMERQLVRLGYHAVTGSAPTPEAAWLAAPEGLHIPGGEVIRRQLGPLPLERLYLDPPRIAAMERMGFRQLRDLLRLPRKALTRRFGPALPDYLDRLLGVRADPRALFQLPETFDSRLELPAEIHASQALQFPLRRLLEELCGVRQCGADPGDHTRPRRCRRQPLGAEPAIPHAGPRPPDDGAARAAGTPAAARAGAGHKPACAAAAEVQRGATYPVPRHARGAAAGHRATG